MHCVIVLRFVSTSLEKYDVLTVPQIKGDMDQQVNQDRILMGSHQGMLKKIEETKAELENLLQAKS